MRPSARTAWLTLSRTPPERLEDRRADALRQSGGFSLLAAIAAGAEERGKPGRLCRYISRPAAPVRMPGVNLMRFHGAFALHHAPDAQTVPGRRRAGEVAEDSFE